MISGEGEADIVNPDARRSRAYAGYRFPPEIIQQAIWLYLRRRQFGYLTREAQGTRYECLPNWFVSDTRLSLRPVCDR